MKRGERYKTKHVCYAYGMASRKHEDMVQLSQGQELVIIGNSTDLDGCIEAQIVNSVKKCRVWEGHVVKC